MLVTLGSQVADLSVGSRTEAPRRSSPAAWDEAVVGLSAVSRPSRPPGDACTGAESPEEVLRQLPFRTTVRRHHGILSASVAPCPT